MITKDLWMTCKMKTYNQLKEQVLEENAVNKAKNFVLGTPTPLPRDPDILGSTSGPTKTQRQGGLLGRGGTANQVKNNVGNFASNNRGMIGAGLAGAVALAGITGLLKARQGKRDNAPQTASTPANLQTTKVSAPGSVGVANKRISPPPTSFSPRKPIDNRDPTRN